VVEGGFSDMVAHTSTVVSFDVKSNCLMEAIPVWVGTASC